MLHNDRARLLFRAGLLLGASASALMFAAPALAQETPETATPETVAETPPADGDTKDETNTVPTDTPAPQPPEEATPESNQEAIIVTGSRLRQTEFTSPSPVTIIDPEVAEKKGTADVAEMLQSSPVATGSPQVTAAISSAFVTNGGPGAQSISLRGLGAERTLVLLNGRRAGPAGTRGAVAAFDLNVLPLSIVENVQVLKDGASSVYGSDAVAGVVNLLTRKTTDGIELQAFGNQSLFKNGGGETRLSATWGREFGDGDGHLLLSADYYGREELKRGQRNYLDCPEDFVFNEAGQRSDVRDPRTGEFTCRDTLWGHVWLYDYTYYYSPNGSNLVGGNGRPIRRLQFDYNQGLDQFVPGVSTPLDPGQFGAPAGWFGVGYDPASYGVENAMHPFISDSTVIPKTRRYTAYADASYLVTDGIEVFGELLYNHRFTYQNAYRQFWSYLYTSNFDFVNGFGGGDPLSAGFTGPVLLSPLTITDHFDSSQKVKYGRGILGLRGEIAGGRWRWEAYGQASRSIGKYMQEQIFQDAIDTQDFRTGSCVGTVTEVRGVPCRDVDWLDPEFLAGNISDEDRAFLFGRDVGKTKYDQRYFEASVAGDLLRLPAGPLGLALGVHLRRDKIHDRPGDIVFALLPGGDPDNPDDFVNNAWGVTASGITAGKNITQEAFGEVRVPILRDMRFFEDLSVQAAARVTNVKATRASDGESASDKNNWTYKLGANWRVNPWLRFRGTYGTSYRAPALFEQFLSDQTAFLGQRSVDPCINWQDNLEAGVISERIAQNCAAQGVPGNHTGTGVTATIITGGGLGVLEPETSKAKTASIILTPRFGFMPNTTFNVAVDYFDILVSGEISQLGARNVVLGCLNSDNFPNDPLCSLFNRVPPGQPGSPNIEFVRDSYINVNEQKNRGIDLTLNVRHDAGGWGIINFLSQMTWQLKDTIALFEGTTESTNGRSGDPKWVGDFNLTWNKGPTTLFYGVDAVGKTSDVKEFVEENGGECVESATLGTFCPRLKVPLTLYHSASITHEFSPRMAITLGVSNIFDKQPRRISTANLATITTLGQVPFQSQYDFMGRRGFVQLKTKF